MQLKSLGLIIVGFIISASCFVNVAKAGLITDEVTVTIGQFGYPNAGSTTVTADDSDAFNVSLPMVTFSADPYDFGLEITLTQCPSMGAPCGGIGILGDSNFFIEFSDLQWVGENREIVGVTINENLTNFFGDSSFTSDSATVSFAGDDSLWSIGQTLSIQLETQVASVPEPSTLAIFAIGMFGLASRRFKK